MQHLSEAARCSARALPGPPAVLGGGNTTAPIGHHQVVVGLVDVAVAAKIALTPKGGGHTHVGPNYGQIVHTHDPIAVDIARPGSSKNIIVIHISIRQRFIPDFILIK